MITVLIYENETPNTQYQNKNKSIMSVLAMSFELSFKV